MNSKLNYIEIGETKVCIGGVGILFHQEGFPIGMAAKELSKKGIELSWFHVVKELYYQYTSNDRLWNKILSEIEDASVECIVVDKDAVKKFCYSDWDTQTEMIFQYLWGDTSNNVISGGNNILKEKISQYVS